jgi:hypothetical protein
MFFNDLKFYKKPSILLKDSYVRICIMKTKTKN